MDGWVSLVALHHKPDDRPSVSVIVSYGVFLGLKAREHPRLCEGN